MTETVTVYDVQYRQTINRGCSDERENWISLATFWSEAEANRIAQRDPDNHDVVPVAMTNDQAFEVCEKPQTAPTKESIMDIIADMDHDKGNDYLDALSEQGPLFTEKMQS